jgi:hypothetical protein
LRAIKGKEGKSGNLVQNHITASFRFRKNIFGQNEQNIQMQDAFCMGPGNIVALTPTLALPVLEIRAGPGSKSRPPGDGESILIKFSLK